MSSAPPFVALHTSQLFGVAREMYRRQGWQREPEYDYRPTPDIVAEAYTLSLRSAGRPVR